MDGNIEVGGSITPHLSRRDIIKAAGVLASSLALVSCVPTDLDFSNIPPSYEPLIDTPEVPLTKEQMLKEMVDIGEYFKGLYIPLAGQELPGYELFVFGNNSRLMTSFYQGAAEYSGSTWYNPDDFKNLEIQQLDIDKIDVPHDPITTEALFWQFHERVKVLPLKIAMAKPYDVEVLPLPQRIGGFAHVGFDGTPQCPFVPKTIQLSDSLFGSAKSVYLSYAHELTHFFNYEEAYSKCVGDLSVVDLLGFDNLLEFTHQFARVKKITVEKYIESAKTDSALPSFSMDMNNWAWGYGGSRDLIDFLCKKFDSSAMLSGELPTDLDYSTMGVDIRTLLDEIRAEDRSLAIGEIAPESSTRFDKTDYFTRFILKNEDYFKSTHPDLYNNVIATLLDHATHMHLYPFDLGRTSQALKFSIEDSFPPDMPRDYYRDLLLLQKRWLNLTGVSLEQYQYFLDQISTQVYNYYSKATLIHEIVSEAVMAHIRADMTRWAADVLTKEEAEAEAVNTFVSGVRLPGLVIPSNPQDEKKVLLQIGEDKLLQLILPDGESVELYNNPSENVISDIEFVTLDPNSQFVFLKYLTLVDGVKQVLFAGPFARESKIEELINHTKKPHITAFSGKTANGKSMDLMILRSKIFIAGDPIGISVAKSEGISQSDPYIQLTKDESNSLIGAEVFICGYLLNLDFDEYDSNNIPRSLFETLKFVNANLRFETNADGKLILNSEGAPQPLIHFRLTDGKEIVFKAKYPERPGATGFVPRKPHIRKDPLLM